MISAERIYKVFGITPGPWEIDSTRSANTTLISTSPQMLVALVNMLDKLISALELLDFKVENDTETMNAIKAIKSSDSKNRTWEELYKELQK